MAIDANWISIGITAAAAVAGTAVNLFIIGRFVGSSTEIVRNLAGVVDKLEERADSYEAAHAQAQLERAALENRLRQAEQAAEVLWRVRDDFTKMRAASEVEERHNREKLDQLGREISGIARQLANLVTTRVGVVKLSGEGGDG